MIKDIKLKFGKVPGATAEAIQVTPVTVFAGPGNRVKRETAAGNRVREH